MCLAGGRSMEMSPSWLRLSAASRFCSCGEVAKGDSPLISLAVVGAKEGYELERRWASSSKRGEQLSGRRKDGFPITLLGWRMVSVCVLSIASLAPRSNILPRSLLELFAPMVSGHAYCEVTPTERELNFDAVFPDQP